MSLEWRAAAIRHVGDAVHDNGRRERECRGTLSAGSGLLGLVEAVLGFYMTELLTAELLMRSYL